MDKADFSPRKTGFIPSPLHVGTVADGMAMGNISPPLPQYFVFASQSYNNIAP
jgi:hypothetical protein